jgi:hypothetical protein
MSPARDCVGWKGTKADDIGGYRGSWNSGEGEGRLRETWSKRVKVLNVSWTSQVGFKITRRRSRDECARCLDDVPSSSMIRRTTCVSLVLLHGALPMKPYDSNGVDCTHKHTKAATSRDVTGRISSVILLSIKVLVSLISSFVRLPDWEGKWSHICHEGFRHEP